MTPKLERVDEKGDKQSVSGPAPVTCTCVCACSWIWDLELAGKLAAFRRWSTVDGRWSIDDVDARS